MLYISINYFIAQQLTSAEPLMLYKQLNLHWLALYLCHLDWRKRSCTQDLLYIASNERTGTCGDGVRRASCEGSVRIGTHMHLG